MTRRNAAHLPSTLALALALAAATALTPAASPGQVTPGGAAGDQAIFLANTAGEELAPAGSPDGQGTDLVQTFDTEVGTTGGSYALNPGGGDATAIALSAGRHLVLYNTEFIDDTPNAGTNRAEIQSNLNLAGADLAIGRAQGYIRDLGGSDETVVTGGAIITVGTDGDVLRLESFRSDTNAGQFVSRRAGASAINLLKLKDEWDFLSLEKTADGAAVGTAFTPVTYDLTVAHTGAAFTFAAGTGEITLNDAGAYLVFANTGLEKPVNNTRTNYLHRLSLDGAEVTGTTTTYLRGNANGENAHTGVAAIGTLVVATAGQVLRVEVAKETGTNSTVTGGRTALTMVKLPASAEYLSLLDTTEQPVNDTGPVTFATQVATSPSFAHTPGGSEVTLVADGRYLFLGSLLTIDDNTNDNADRVVVNHGWSIDGGGILPYGQGAEYLRDAGQRTAGSWSGVAFSGTAGQVVEMVTRPIGNLNEGAEGDVVALHAIDVNSLLISTDPTLLTNKRLALLINTTATIDAGLLRTADADHTAAELVYTLTSEPTGGTLRHTVDGAIGDGGTFTQDDVNNGRIEFDAGGADGTGFGFDFTVTDGATPADGTFAISVGVVTALVDDTGATSEDAALSQLDGAADNLFANDTGTGLTVVAADATSALGAAVTVNRDGTFTYDPTAAAALQGLDDGGSAVDTFTYTAADFEGAENIATVTITVAGANDAPAVVGESFPGSPQPRDLLANDSDVDAGDTLSVTGFEGGPIGTLTTPEGATVTIGADGTFVYDARTSASINALGAGAQITENLTYEVSDGTATSTGTVTVTSTGEEGARHDPVTADADASVNFDPLANDRMVDPAGAGAALGGAAYEFLAATAGNTDSTWNYTGTAGTVASVSPANPGAQSFLDLSPANAPPGAGAVYRFTGTNSGAGHEDMEHPSFGAIHQMDVTFEMVFRPSDRTGNEVLWETGGNGTGASLTLLEDSIAFTISGNRGPDTAQVLAPLPAGATGGGDFVHVIALIDTDAAAGAGSLELIVNGISFGTDTMRNLVTGAALPLDDWSGTDAGGIAIFQGTIGGDINELGLDGTTEIPAGMARFAGEVASVRIYTSLLTPAERAANLEAVFGSARSAAAGDVADLAGVAAPTPGATSVDLPSGAVVRFEANGTFTYDPSGAFDEVPIGFTVVDSFTYALGSSLNPTATVTVAVAGQNPDPRITIEAAQANVGEGGTATFNLIASAPVAGDVGVNLSYSGSAIDGSDYTGQASVTIPDGQSGATLDLAIVDDNLYEGAEDLVVTITGVVNAATLDAILTASTVIEDAQSPPEFSIAGPAGDVAEGGPARFTITASVASDEPITVGHSYGGTAVQGDDFLGPIAANDFPPGTTTADLVIGTFDDGVAEGAETIDVTLANPSIGSVSTAAGTAGFNLVDGAGRIAFWADFNDVDPAGTPGGTLLNTDAPAAANLGTATGSWENVFTADQGGNDPGVIDEGGPDVKGDGVDGALRLDRPPPGEGEVCARFDGVVDFSGTHSAAIRFDLGLRRTQNNSEAKSVRFIGFDPDGNKSFELYLSANNNAPNNEQLHHVDSAGTLTPLGAAADFNNSGGYREDRMSGVTLWLTSSGFVVGIDRFPLTPAPDLASVTGPLAYAGPARSISKILFDIPGSNDNAINGGIYLDDVRAAGFPLAGSGVRVGGSTLIGDVDYSDSFTIGETAPTAARQAYVPQDFPLPAGVEAVENTGRNPAANWPSNAWSIATDTINNPGGTGYPGGSGAGSDTGVTQRGGGGDWSIPYGKRGVFVVQTDFIQQPDRVDITVGQTPGNIFGAGNLSVFFRQTAHPQHPEIGIFNGVLESDTGLTSGIDGPGEWHNYALLVDMPGRTIEVFVDEVSRGLIDLATVGGGAYAGILDNSYVGVGGAGADRLWSDNFQVGAAAPARVTRMRLRHFASVDSIVAGSARQNLSLAVTVTNRGPRPATGVRVALDLTLPAGVRVAYSVPNGVGNLWIVGDLGVGQTKVLILQLEVGAGAAAGQDVIVSEASLLPSNGDAPVRVTASIEGAPVDNSADDAGSAFAQTLQAAFPDDFGDAATRATVWGPNADPDGDGIPNFIEFALGSDPNNSASVPATPIAVVNVGGQNFLELTFDQLVERAGFSYVVELSENLEVFARGFDFVRQVASPAGAPAGYQRVVYRSTFPLPPNGMQALRVRVRLLRNRG